MNFADTWQTRLVAFLEKRSPALYIVAALALVYALPGLFSHAPWKPTDAVSIGLALDQFRLGFSPFATLTNESWLVGGPLNAIIGGAFLHLSSLWPFEPVGLVRLPNLFYLAGMLFIAYRLGRLYDEESGQWAMPLLLIGLVALLIPVHEASSVTLVAFLWMVGYFAAVKASNHPVAAGLASGLSLAATFLTLGLAPSTFVQAAMPILALCQLFNGESPTGTARNRLFYIATTLIAAALPILLWLIWAEARSPETLTLWWRFQLAALTLDPVSLAKLLAIVKLISWTAWPAWPLALYTVVAARSRLFEPRYLFPLSLFLVALLALFLTGHPRLDASLALCLPLVVLATDRITSLPPSLSGLLGWFSALIFSLVAVYLWVGFSALVLGIPSGYSSQLARVFPDFLYPDRPIRVVLALAIFVGWLVLVFSRQKTPLRDLLNWTGGLTLFWAIGMLLGLPLLDHLRSYDNVSRRIAEAIEADHRQTSGDFARPCVDYRNLGPTQRGSIAYYTDLDLRPDSGECGYLLVQSSVRDESAPPGFSLLLTTRRPKDRTEVYRLYRREAEGEF